MKTELGVVYYDEDGKPICNICGKSFKKLISHVIQKHDMSGHEYKKLYGLDIHKSIMSLESQKLASLRAIENLEKIKDNLVISGSSTRFKKGHNGRTREKVSPQTFRRLKNQMSKLNRKQNGN